MSMLQQAIRDKFLKKLSDEASLDAGKVEKLRALLSGSKKPKADEFVKIFSIAAEGDIK